MDLGGIETVLAGNWQPLRDEAHQDSPLIPLLAHEIDRCLDNEQTVDAYRSAKAGINLYRRESEDQHKGEGWAVGPREIEMAATGLFFLRDPRLEGDLLFPMLPTFSSAREASEQLRWWLKHDDERQEAAGQARAAVADRTFMRNARDLMGHLERL